ncbi:hypothetical protein GCM10011579_033490 [Streptomyces albiflavescens]|uniref:Transposase IS116/IS110/IS902 C-terminal domain-containing protein n=1 Tax=Streptomyces albiflavescens TaxID=1623582 RepID=A0A918D4P8_9ACTN|nr:hypothetical protein GCM10011579_033490 [Streptomyces albiflavescens]
MDDEAPLAALCGVSPVEASSDKTQRRRLNRGGDRRANSALHTIVLARLRRDTRTRDHVERRVAQEKARRESHPLPQTLRRTRDLSGDQPTQVHCGVGVLTSTGASNLPSATRRPSS